MKKVLILAMILNVSCGPSGPDFDEDHAFEYLLKQCEFGPRNPSSEGYYKCLEFMLEELDKTADDIIIQEFSYRKVERIREVIFFSTLI